MIFRCSQELTRQHSQIGLSTYDFYFAIAQASQSTRDDREMFLL